jgi:hypothetical protein
MHDLLEVAVRQGVNLDKEGWGCWLEWRTKEIAMVQEGYVTSGGETHAYIAEKGGSVG